MAICIDIGNISMSEYYNQMKIILTELAAKIGAKLETSDSSIITGIAPLNKATPQEISFFSNRKYRNELSKTKAAAVILTEKDCSFCKVAKLIMDNPYLGYAKAANLFSPPIPKPPGIHPSAYVNPDVILDSDVYVGPQVVIEAGAKLGKGVIVGPGCVIESGVEIGANCQLKANVTICSGSKIGQRIIIHPGAVVGSDGFGNATDGERWVKVPQIGGVFVGDDVEIGANTTIDKGALEDTYIANGVRLDNLIQIAHNVQIGEHTAIAGCVGIAGSTKIGKNCLIGGGVGISGHLEIVDNVCVTGGSIILRSIRKAGVYSSGTPIENNQHWHRNYLRFKQLNEMALRLKKLELGK
ncbi:UDP-3-O-(3-hydroxymyristoyl)glucosamine N-acyltransferase [Thiotrichales bacterium HSG1]|nr:UDP-3-O-(3-hydroxymyristoyl)glucosamine N-acyltransferase [Thiotrichales bacterium HSG1]